MGSPASEASLALPLSVTIYCTLLINMSGTVRYFLCIALLDLRSPSGEILL